MAADTLMYDKYGNLIGYTGQNSHQSFSFFDTDNQSVGCYAANIASKNGVLSTYEDSTFTDSPCWNSTPNDWFTHLDGASTNTGYQNLY